MAPTLPAEVWQTVALYTSRKTRLRLSATSHAIRKAVLPSIFETLTLTALTLAELRKALETAEPETLALVRKLTVRIHWRTDGSTDSLSMPTFDSGAARMFRHLVQAMSKAGELVLQIKLPSSYDPSSLYTTNNAANWSQLANLVVAACRDRVPMPRFKIQFDNLIITNISHIGLLVNILQKFEEVQIKRLSLDFASEHLTLPVNDHLANSIIDRLEALSHISSTSVLRAHNALHIALAAKLPTDELDISCALEMDNWASISQLPSARIKNLKDLHINCNTSNTYDILTFLKLFEGSTTLKFVSLAFMNAEVFELLTKADFKQILGSLKDLRAVNVMLLSDVGPWDAVQKVLESLQKDLGDMNSILALETYYYERMGSSRAPKGCPFPLSAPLLKDLHTLRIIVNDDIVLQKDRANRVTLPSVTDLHFELVADPPAATSTAESIVQWYLDGLHLPALERLYLVVGIEPELVRPIAIHLPLLASCQRLEISNAPTLRFEGEEFEEIGKEFMESLDRIRLERACDSLGIDVVYTFT